MKQTSQVMKKAEQTEVGFVCSFDMAGDHEINFTFNPNKRLRYSARKSPSTNSASNQRQSHQTKAQKNASLKRSISQPQRSQGATSTPTTASQPSKTTPIASQSQLQVAASAQQVSLNSQVLLNQNSKASINDQNVSTQKVQQQSNLQPIQPPTNVQQSDINPISQANTKQMPNSSNSIQRPNMNSNSIETANITDHQNPPDQSKQTADPGHPTNPTQNLSISNTSPAYKNPIYQQYFSPNKSQPQPQPPQPQAQQSTQQTQVQQQPQQTAKPPQPQIQTQIQTQPTKTQQIQPQQPPPQIQPAAIIQAHLALLLKTQNINALPASTQMTIHRLLQQYQQQQQIINMQRYKEKVDTKPSTANKKKSRSNKQNANDDFCLRNDNSRKKVLVPASTTMYQTHHKHHKVIKDILSDEESDTYVPCTSSSDSPTSSSSSDSEEDEEVVPVKSRSSSSSHTTIKNTHIDHSKKVKKIYIKPIDPRIKLKRRYASWAEITGYGQWKWAAKDRPHVIEDPRGALDYGKNGIKNERSEPLEFGHEFTLFECLKVVSDNIPTLKKDVSIISDVNEQERSNSDSNLSKSSSFSNLNVGLSKSDSTSFFSSDKIGLASVITPVITKRRLQRPNHIRLAKIIDNFDGKMRNITCRACNMLDRLLLREILKNTAPSLHQSLQEIAPYVWRDFQPENLQSSAKSQQSNSAGNRRKKKKNVTLTTALAQSSVEEVEDAFHVIKQTFEFLNISEKEETNYACEIRHMNFSQDYTFQPSFDDLVRYFRRVKGKFVSRSSSGYVLE